MQSGGIARTGPMAFPITRMRRLRTNGRIRDLLAENRLDTTRMIYPLFIDERIGKKRELELLPGQFVYPVEQAGAEASALEAKGVGAVLLFGIPGKKDERGTGAYSEKGAVQRAVRSIKESSGMVVATDLCMCEYTSGGQCGLVTGGSVDNDATLEQYARIAVSQAEAGADLVAPSGMMDGQVMAIRRALDSAGFQKRMILAYSSKSASSFYGPFREAAESSPSGGDRRDHQLNYSNQRESMREMQLDAEEGADILMVKPALPNLDIISKARARFDLPLAAYSVSGEYGMLRAAASAGMVDYRPAVTEVVTSIFRAGADLLVTYHADELADWLNG